MVECWDELMVGSLALRRAEHLVSNLAVLRGPMRVARLVDSWVLHLVEKKGESWAEQKDASWAVWTVWN